MTAVLLTAGFGSAMSLKGVFKDKFDLLNNKHVNWKTQRKDTQIANKTNIADIKLKTFHKYMMFKDKNNNACIETLKILHLGESVHHQESQVWLVGCSQDEKVANLFWFLGNNCVSSQNDEQMT